MASALTVAVVLGIAMQVANAPQTKPYSSHKQPLHSWDVFMASPEAIEAARKLHGDCGDARTQDVMSACFEGAYAKADTSLRAVYEHSLKVLSGQTKRDLVVAQTAWLKHRDKKCKAEADQEEGGSIQPTVYYSCMQESTISRQKELVSRFRLEQ